MTDIKTAAEASIRRAGQSFVGAIPKEQLTALLAADLIAELTKQESISRAELFEIEKALSQHEPTID